jgi:hypothetical protein
MPKWLRSVIGVLAGGANLYANGTGWKEVLLSLAVAALGIVSHLSSSGPSSSNSSAPSRK